ncbi:MAG: phosphatidate cytidylyltransferase, partial [Candidatus Hermodarchaeota archaeon]
FLYALIKVKKYEAYDLNKNLEDDLDNSMDRVFLDVYNFTPKQEMQRKFIHLLSILYLLAWTLEPIIFYGVQFLYAGIANTTTAENYYNAKLLFEYEDTELILYNGLVVQFFMFICIFMVNANIEIMRLRFREYDYFMKRVILKTRRPTELYDITASNLLLLGLATSAIILTYSSEYKLAGIYAQMAVICITVLSDMFAALIGRRFGKHKWPLLKGKSIEGSLAGFLVGFFTAMIFVGWFLALIGAFIFVFTDIILAKVEISDNASNPILLAIIFKCLIIFVNPMITILPIIKIW